MKQNDNSDFYKNSKFKKQSSIDKMNYFKNVEKNENE